MTTIYLALLLFGSDQACYAEIRCPAHSRACTAHFKSCAVTLPECLEAKLVTSLGGLPILGCQNKPNPKTADVSL